MNNRIIVLGSRGMLGQMVYKYFTKSGYNVSEFNKRFDVDSIASYMTELNYFEDSIIINCIGLIKQKSNSDHDLLFINSIFPLELCRSLKPGHFLVHPSTDCVFGGNEFFKYELNFQHNAEDIYGISKSLGESAIINRPNSIIIRVSIIGPDSNSNKGLLGWFLSQPSRSILNGYTNHFWNGITTLEWCIKVEEILRNNLNYKNISKIFQLGTKEVYTKFDMLIIFQNVFKTDYIINEFSDSLKIDRTLSVVNYSKSLPSQLFDLVQFMNNKS